MTPAPLRKLLGFSLIALGLVAAPGPDATACGAFFRPEAVKHAASLSFERVLIIHDPATETEHFIREIVFRGEREKFGFVVPTPTKPDVFKVKSSPFDKLEAVFPFAPPRQLSRGMEGAGAPPGGGGAKVVILDIKKIGSFTAFVLKATDAGALDKWLKDNKLGSSPENDTWLAEYVKRGFYYVAFRYEPSSDKTADGALKAETVRITFQTPVAYYPYREPAHAAASAEGEKPRAVALWLVSPTPLVPVALTREDGRDVWVNPFSEGFRREGLPASLILGQLGDDEKKLLDDTKSYVVQPLEDQKRQRVGYGDVVFLPEKGVPSTSREKVTKLVTSLLSPSQPSPVQGAGK